MTQNPPLTGAEMAQRIRDFLRSQGTRRGGRTEVGPIMVALAMDGVRRRDVEAGISFGARHGWWHYDTMGVILPTAQGLTAA